jgi:hypothetical protein
MAGLEVRPEKFFFASSAEFVGELWLWKFSEGVI